MDLYPLQFRPIYKEKIWGGRNLERLFGRDDLPPTVPIGESWELADLPEGVTVVAEGALAGRTLTDLTAEYGPDLLGRSRPLENGRFPLLLKLLDANDILSLQVHPDEDAVAEIGPEAALKTECWYIAESRDGSIYKGVKEGVTPEQFRQAIQNDTVEQYVRKYDCRTGDFHYLPAGTVHALGAGLVVAEVQTPSDTAYRVTDWGRGREIHVERSMQCIHFEPADDAVPGQEGDRLLATPYFDVYLRRAEPGTHAIPGGRCAAWMVLSGTGRLTGEGFEAVAIRAGQTYLIPACLRDLTLELDEASTCLETILPEED